MQGTLRLSDEQPGDQQSDAGMAGGQSLRALLVPEAGPQSVAVSAFGVAAAQPDTEHLDAHGSVGHVLLPVLLRLPRPLHRPHR